MARRSRKPQVVQNEVLARTLAGQSKSQIAHEMTINRRTVTSIQEVHNITQLLPPSPLGAIHLCSQPPEDLEVVPQ